MGSYYAALTFLSLGEKSQVPKRYAKRYMQTTADLFYRWIPKPEIDALDSKKQWHLGWVLWQQSLQSDSLGPYPICREKKKARELRG